MKEQKTVTLNYDQMKVLACTERFIRSEYLVGKGEDDSRTDVYKIWRHKRRGKTAEVICARIRGILEVKA